MSDAAQFNGTIGPSNLLSLVRNTAPFLFALPRPAPPSGRLILMGADALGYVDILQHAENLEPARDPSTEQREDYFALCIASHHATVATFIPTDVDAKIRGTLWQQREDPQALRRMFDLSVQWLNWDISGISTRATELSGVGPVSGHNGEMLGVLAGALGGFLKNGDAEYAEKAAETIDGELKREAHEYRHVMEMKGREIDLLRLSSSLTHNVGDLDQGVSFWSNKEIYQPYRERFHRLAHENTASFGGTFQTAAKVYKKIMSAEGHRHYPLRAVKALRASPDFLLPLGPFFDDWGATIARHATLSVDDKADVLAALISGCKKIPNQLGYYRAISGFFSALTNKQQEEMIKRMPASLRQEAKEPEIRRHIALQKISFESGMRKRCLAAL